MHLKFKQYLSTAIYIYNMKHRKKKIIALSNYLSSYAKRFNNRHKQIQICFTSSNIWSNFRHSNKSKMCRQINSLSSHWNRICTRKSTYQIYIYIYYNNFIFMSICKLEAIWVVNSLWDLLIIISQFCLINILYKWIVSRPFLS